MAYENVRFTSTNMSGDRSVSYFYTVSGGILYKKNKTTGVVVSGYPPDYNIGEVSSLQFDGVYYWTLERQSGGFLIRKWEIVGSILRQRKIFSYVSDVSINYDSYSFSVDYFSTVLTSPAFVGSSYVEVDDPSLFTVGDTVVIGPSTSAGFIDNYRTYVVSSTDANGIYFTTPIGSNFGNGDFVYCTKYFYVFNKYSPYDNTKGSLLKLDFNTGVLVSYSSGSEFSDVKASCFYDGKILFVKGNEVVFINPAHLTFSKHMAIENLDTNRADIVPTYAMFAYSDVLYSLRNKYVYYSGSSWSSESWGSQYSYVSSSLLPIAYFIELRATPDVLHAVSLPSVPTALSNISLTVLDQYRVPMPSKTVNFTTSIGSVLPVSGVTDTNGQIAVVYSGTSSEGTAEIKATVL